MVTRIVLSTLALILAAASPALSDSLGFVTNGGGITTLRPAGATFTQAIGINDLGQVVGYYSTNGGAGYDGFLWSDGTYTTFSVPGATTTVPWGINNSGQISGYYIQSGTAHPFLYSGGNYTMLAPSGWAHGINDLGQVVGWNGSTAFLYSGGTYTTIDVPGVPTAINNLGQIAGSFNQNGYLLDGESYTIINVPGTIGTNPLGINDLGQVVGQTSTGLETLGFLFSGGNYTTFNLPPSIGLFGINNSGQLVGSYEGVAPAPGPIVGGDLPGTLMALAGFIGWRRSRRLSTQT